MKFLVIGGGSIGKRHVRNLFKLYPNCKICHYYTFSAPLVPEKGWNYCAISTLESLCSDERFDACIIASPASKHLEHFKLSWERSAKIFIEKPLCRYDQLLEMEQLIASIPDPPAIFVGYILRHDPIILKAKCIIDSGQYGKLLSARVWAGQFLPQWRPEVHYKQTVSGSNQLGGGVLHELSHELDYITYLAGFPHCVFAAVGKFSTLEIDVEDLAHITLIYPDKIVSVALDFYCQKPSLGFEILLEKTTINADFQQRRLVLSDSRHDTVIPVDIDSFNDLYIQQFQALMDNACLPSYICDFRNGLRVMELINALKNSAKLLTVAPIKSTIA